MAGNGQPGSERTQLYTGGSKGRECLHADVRVRKLYIASFDRAYGDQARLHCVRQSDVFGHSER